MLRVFQKGEDGGGLEASSVEGWLTCIRTAAGGTPPSCGASSPPPSSCQVCPAPSHRASLPLFQTAHMQLYRCSRYCPLPLSPPSSLPSFLPCCQIPSTVTQGRELPINQLSELLRQEVRRDCVTVFLNQKEGEQSRVGHKSTAELGQCCTACCCTLGSARFSLCAAHVL